METYLQLRFNLIWAARSLLVPCTVGSVSHPSFQMPLLWFSARGDVGQHSHKQNVLFDPDNFPSRLPCEMLSGVVGRGGSCTVRTRRTLSGMDDTLTNSDGAGNLLSPPLQDRRRWGLTANTL